MHLFIYWFYVYKSFTCLLMYWNCNRMSQISYVQLSFTSLIALSFIHPVTFGTIFKI